MTGGHLMILNEYTIKKHIEQKAHLNFDLAQLAKKKKTKVRHHTS